MKNISATKRSFFLVFVFLLQVYTSAFAERVVSLSPALTDTICELGAPDQVIAVTDYCAHSEIRNKQRVGGILDPDLEALVMLKPDLVLASSMTPRSVISRIQGLGIGVYVFELNSISDIISSAKKIAEILGVPCPNYTYPGAETQPCARAALLMSGPLIHAAGSGTYLDDYMALAGVSNIVKDLGTSWPVISPEFLLESEPDVIIYVGSLECHQALKSYPMRTSYISLDPEVAYLPSVRILSEIDALKKQISQ